MREKNDAELKQKQVRNKDDTEDGKIKDDPERNRRNGGGYYARSRREPPEFEDEDDIYAVDPRRGHFLDISL